MEKGKRLFSNTLLLGGSALFCKLLSLCFLPFYTSALTPSAFGVAEIFVVTAVLIMPLFSFYAPHATFRFLLKGERGAIRSGAWLLGAGLAFFACFIPLIGRISALRPYRHLFYFYVCASLLRSFLSHILRARGKFGIFALQQSFCALLTVLLQVLFLRATQLGATGYLLGVVLGDGITFLILLICFFPFLKEGGGKSRLRCGEMLRYALPLMPAAILWWTMGAVEKYFLLYYHGEASMGLYGVAGRFPSLIGFATGIFLEAWHFTSLQVKKGEEGELFGRIYALLLPFAMGIGVVVGVFSPLLISGAIAGGYGEAARVVVLLSFGGVCGGLASFLDSIYTLRLRSINSLFTALLSASFNVFLSFLLVPRWGIVGAATAGALSFGALFFLRLFHTSQLLDFPRYVKRSALSLLLFFVSGVLMAGKYTVFATVMALIALLPLGTLFAKATLFFCNRFRVFLIHVWKNTWYSKKRYR